MSVKSDALEFGVTALAAGAVLWYASRKLGKGVDQVKQWVSDAGSAVANGASATWDTATSPVLPTDTGVSAVDGAAAIGNGVVAAPSGVVDSLSMGLIGGSGGTSGNGGLGGWLWGIVNGSAFAPSGAGSTPGAQPDSGAGFDLGNSQGW
ncbi:hypothetical protein [Burkholderia cepacia]|uniref:hypothetical protein n=1 Tax=Burkholderia cepacia TaxID=292 RepID=UPI001CF2BC24|nr:hypothetical protein [Burkholderia cepacia]MCA8115670.1 hypothetical protein [Burkholderia cepacia]MCA8402757.1 hypothetical protein [Burkholderia cepacia]